MRCILLSDGQLALVDDEDYEELNKHKWFPKKGAHTVYTHRHNGTGATRTSVAMHRQILNAAPRQDCDHINGDGLDNRRANLRVCTRTQNQWNSRPRGKTSLYKGVCWNKARRKWIAQINTIGYTQHIGIFNNEIDAARAFDIKALEGHGEFARLNFPEEHK